MDRRSLLFIISLTFTLLAVNYYFESSHREELEIWRKEQVAKKREEIQTLKAKLADFVEKPVKLPLIDNGIEVDGVQMILDQESESGVRISANKESANLKTTSLPNEGSFPLILLSFDAEGTPVLTPADFVDGEVQYPIRKIQALEQEIGEPVTDVSLPATALVLLHSKPVAVLHEGAFSHLASLSQYITADKPKNNDVEGDEKYYVIQNSLQQLVFTNRGGAIIGINLPFQSEENQKSVVKPIQFDREMVKKFPNNAHFPEFPYLTADSHGTKQEHEIGQLGGFYPLLRRKLKNDAVDPKFYAFNLVSNYPETAKTLYTVTKFDDKSITFVSDEGHRKISKTFSLSDEENAPYTLTLDLNIEGNSKNLWLTSGVPDVEIISGAPAPALKYRITRNGQSEVVKLDIPKQPMTLTSIYPDWVCNSNGFFGMIVDPLTKISPGFKVDPIPGTILPSRLILFSDTNSALQAEKLPGYAMLLPLSDQGGSMQFRIFAGPFQSNILKTVDAAFSNPDTGYNPDYIASRSFHGWFAFISAPLSKLFLFLMKIFHAVTGSWAASIVLLSVFIRVILYPLNAWSTKSMIKMQEIAPKVNAIQEKYKNDPKRAQVEILNLYRNAGANPLSGCLPLIIQMPFIFVMLDVLKSSFSLRGAEFIPGWINDLSAPDVLFSWETPIFFIGNQFHLLPILLGGVMFLQQKIMSPNGTKNPSEMTDQQRQQRAMGSMMTVVFTLMFYHFPSGLNIYWLTSMLLGIGQQKLTKRMMDKEPKQKDGDIIELKPKTKKKKK